MINSLNEEKVNLFILETTKSEIESNIEDALSIFERVDDNSLIKNLTYKNCIENNISSSDLQQMFINLEEILQKYCINFYDEPDFNTYRQYQIDEMKLYNTIVKTYKMHNGNHYDDQVIEKSEDFVLNSDIKKLIA